MIPCSSIQTTNYSDHQQILVRIWNSICLSIVTSAAIVTHVHLYAYVIQGHYDRAKKTVFLGEITIAKSNSNTILPLTRTCKTIPTMPSL